MLASRRDALLSYYFDQFYIATFYNHMVMNKMSFLFPLEIRPSLSRYGKDSLLYREERRNFYLSRYGKNSLLYREREALPKLRPRKNEVLKNVSAEPRFEPRTSRTNNGRSRPLDRRGAPSC